MDQENNNLNLPENEPIPEITDENEGTVINVDLTNEMRTSFLSYAMSVITDRALPDVRDGLKPVHRRILYTMFENGLNPDKEYRKCADTVGAVLGRYHPHGDASVYDAMVRLAQDFSMRYPLVDGHGNFGSVDGDPPAAYRYTESRMSKLTLRMLTDIDKETVDFIPNYDDRLKEPTVLPSRFPNLLVNGTMGIAVGMATNIPPHNMSEVIDGMCCLIDNPDCTLDDLMEHIKGPDFPTAGVIMGRAGIRAAYATGRGKVVVRARTEIIENKNGRTQIKVTQLPYQVNKSKLIERIAELHKEKKIEGISNVSDFSSARSGMNVIIDLKRDANANVILNQLYSYTELQSSFGVIMLALVDGEPKLMTLKQVLQHYVDHQCEVVRRRTEFDLKKAQDRAHILEGLLKALDFIDEVIAILRASKSIPEGKEALMARFGFDEIQANHIVQMRLGQLTGLEKEKLEDELGELRIRIARFLEILSSHENILQLVKEEALQTKAEIGDARRTEIVNVSGEVDIEDLIPNVQSVFTKTVMGYIKRVPVEEYAVQRKGGRGKLGLTTREEDVVDTMFTSNTHSFLMFFTTKGKAYRLKGYEIPESSRTGKGMNLVNLLPLDADEKVSAMLRLPDDDTDVYLTMITRQGVIKRTALHDFVNIRKSGIIAINIDEGDVLDHVLLTNGRDDLFVATKNGLGIRFTEKDARVLGRTARGVKAISFKGEDDEVVGAEVIKENETDGAILTISEDGTGRRSAYDDYRVQNRGGFGTLNYRTEKFGRVAAIRKVYDDDDVIVISSAGIIIRLHAADVRLCARPSKGVRLIRLGENDRVVTVTTAKREEKEAAAETPVSEPDADETPVGGMDPEAQPAAAAESDNQNLTDPEEENHGE